MRITKEILLRVAKETAQKRAFSDPALVAAYLTGSLRTNEPFLGGATDIDIVFVHPGPPPVRREIVPVMPDVHLDILHNPRREYDRPKELRQHSWLGPELYDPLPLHNPQHFFEFVQAGLRDRFHDPANVYARARRNAERSRQVWSGLQAGGQDGPGLLLAYLKSLCLAANAVAVLSGSPLAERRFLLQFPVRAASAGRPELTEMLVRLLGGGEAQVESLSARLAAWEADFSTAAGLPQVDPHLAAPRLTYYRTACEAILAGDTPQAVLWPLLLTWTKAAQALPPDCRAAWESICRDLGLLGPGFDEKLAGVDHFLDVVEELLDSGPA